MEKIFARDKRKMTACGVLGALYALATVLGVTIRKEGTLAQFGLSHIGWMVLLAAVYALALYGLFALMTCAEKAKYANVPCFFNANDMGIAVGSAVALAANLRVDNRVMFSVGKVAKDMDLLPGCSMVLAIPLSVSGKSPFFDRK